MAFTKITASGIDTAGTVTTESISVSGVSTIGSLSIGSTQVISSAFQLQNIASLDATTTATIETAIQQAPNNFTSLNISGISTLQSTTLIGGGTSTGTASQPLQVTGGAYVSGNLGVGATNPIGFGTAKAVIARAFGKGSGVGLWVEAGDNTGSIKDNVALVLNDSSSGSSGGNSLIFRQTNPGSPRRYAGIWGVTNLSGSGGNLIFGTIGSDNDTTGPIGRAQIDGSGNLLIANDTATGTASQPLQVTGGAYVSGSLGIGSIAPGYKLDVLTSSYPTSKFKGTFTINSKQYTAIVIGDIGTNLGAGIGYVYDTLTPSNSFFNITPYGSSEGTSFVVNTSGNVGIGLTNPSYKLDVVGPSNNGYFQFRGASTSSGYGSFLNSAGNNIAYFGNGAGGAISGGNSTDFAIGVSNNLIFAVSNSEKVRIDSSGNLGIGVIPSAWVDDKAFQIMYGAISSGYEYGVSIAANAYRSTSNVWKYLNGQPAFRANINNAGFQWFTSPSGTTNNAITFTQSMTLDSSGNLGIGTASPAENLHIHNPNTSLSVIRLSGSAASQTPFNIRQGIVGTNNGGFSIYDVNNSATRFAIDPSGNIGIGTVSPTEKLHVHGNIRLSTIGQLRLNSFGRIGCEAQQIGNMVYSGLYGANITYLAKYESGWKSTGGGNASAITIDEGRFTFANSQSVSSADTAIVWTDRLSITTTGNIGIGTVSPLTKLDVRGTITAGADATSGSEIIRGYYSGGGSLNVIGSEYSSGGLVLGSSVKPSTSASSAFFSSTGISVSRGAYTIAGNEHRWYIGAVQTVAENSSVTMSEVMRINASGNLGIGTVIPAEKLHVHNGSIRTDGLYGRRFTDFTSTSGTTGYIDTGFAPDTPAAVYQLYISVNPLTAGSSAYRDVVYGKVFYGTGWNGSTVTSYIYFVQENPSRMYISGGSEIFVDVVFLRNSVMYNTLPFSDLYTNTQFRIVVNSPSQVGTYISATFHRVHY